ncbi:unnamed protein product [Trichogramma brassicae]|uniref:Uncharacterized protein n=1 Tax=Trichogramma brassicae TaxID=86971 RepID=A0A6H5IJ75_9HYME|nr:unnamed protein product [Trichogramma brassicae]
MIGELDWMDATTRARAHRKLQAMRLWVGYPDWIHDPKKLDKHYENFTVVEYNLLKTILGLTGLEVKTSLNALRKKPDKNRWVTSGTTANAYYSVILNSVRRRYNEEGVLRQWWSDETLKHYSAKVECIIKQYDNYSVPELGHNFTVNGFNTQGENIADNGGLREAYRAYSKLRKRRPSQQIALPGLVDYSQDQLFFLGYANVWCGNQTLGAYKTNLVENVHAPNRFRVIGTLSNNEDFAKAWQCPRGSPMNPVHKCVLCSGLKKSTDAITKDEALSMLRANSSRRAELESSLRATGLPAYTTQIGWLGYGDEQLKSLCAKYLAQGYKAFKAKVGQDLASDLRRCEIIRKAIGYEEGSDVECQSGWTGRQAVVSMDEDLAQFKV